MPVRYVTGDEVPLYAEVDGEAVLRWLHRGDQVDLDGARPPQGGRQLARHADWVGWVDPDALTASGIGLVASGRRSGVALPERLAPPRRPPPREPDPAAAAGGEGGLGEAHPAGRWRRPRLQSAEPPEWRDEAPILEDWVIQSLLWILVFVVLAWITFRVSTLPTVETVGVTVVLFVALRLSFHLAFRRRPLRGRGTDARS